MTVQVGGQHVTRSETFTFSPQTPRMPFPSWLNLEELRKPDGDFFAAGKLLFRVAIKVSHARPPGSGYLGTVHSLHGASCL